ncbi:hypothetical protein HOLleu_45219 [Holothuria leucospilota]|uniref:Uncharacterized protein n=1 Tax=Holothuria leucospilota TaxID=206669 RepID=A0A9Q1BAH2_HOLLE|nr:hypothetical protein HOLleu_45219 [Holothuria leucospilota]
MRRFQPFSTAAVNRILGYMYRNRQIHLQTLKSRVSFFLIISIDTCQVVITK